MSPEKIKIKTEEAVAFFNDRMLKMDQGRREFVNLFDEYEKLFRSQIETSNKADWQSKFFIPRTYGLVMSTLSEFSINKPDISVEPDTQLEATKVPYMHAVMNANWRKNKGNAELLYALLDTIKLGIAIIEVGYRKTKRTIKEITEYNTETEKIEWKSKDIFDFDDVYFETVNPRFFWVDESVSTISEANDCARQYIYSEARFHQIFDSKFTKAKEVKSKGTLIDENINTTVFFGPNVANGEVSVFRYINKGGDFMWWMANGVLLNKVDDPIPYHHKQLPYTEIKIAPYDKYTFYGISLPHILRDIQHELNTTRNMIVDQTHLNVFSPFFYSGDEDIDETIFSVEPGIGIPVSDPNNFKFFKQSQVGEDAWRLMDKFDDDARQATGFDLRLQGLPSGGTATETAILKETSLKRINLYLRFLEDLSLPDFAEIWGDTLQQFYFQSSEIKSKKVRKNGTEKEEIFRSLKIPKADIASFRMVEQVEGFNFLDVTADDIRGKFGFNVRIGTSIAISKELDKQTKLQLYSMLGAEQLIKREKLLIDVLKAHERDPEEYMNITPEVDLEQSIQLAQEQNKQIMGGQDPQIIAELITVEHIQIHDALLKSGNIDKDTKDRLLKHTLQEIRLSRLGGLGKQTPAFGTEEFTAQERTPQLSQPLVKQPGFPTEAKLPVTSAEMSVAPQRPVIRPKL